MYTIPASIVEAEAIQMTLISSRGPQKFQQELQGSPTLPVDSYFIAKISSVSDIVTLVLQSCLPVSSV